jgi:ketosteroid isomerase-like protein
VIREDNDWIRQLFECVDAKDVDGFLEFLADDVKFRFGNAPAVTGKDSVQKSIESFFASIEGLSHRILETWVHPETVICNGEVTYTRIDSSQVTIPFANILRMEGECIKDYLIYIDITSLYSKED